VALPHRPENAEQYFFPPGYTSGASLRGMLRGRDKFNIKPFWELTYEELIAQQYVIVGSPATVAEKLAVYTDELGAGIHVAGACRSAPCRTGRS